MSTAAVLALTALNERHIVKAFRAERAITGSTARRLRDLGLGPSQTLRRMVASTILRKAGPERYFLDEDVWATRRQLPGRTIVRIAVALGCAAVAATLYLVTR